MKKLVKALFVAVILLALVLCAFLLNEYMEKRKYRLDYPAEIMASSVEFNLDPYLVAAVIHCESGNRPAVVSAKGAVGLMQIMPDTGGWIAAKLGITDFTEAMLTDPSLNIRLGCWYLHYLLNRFEGVRSHALAAYNAGPGNLTKWLEDEAYSQDGRLTQIPFTETDNYVGRVEQAYETYKKLYPGELG